MSDENKEAEKSEAKAAETQAPKPVEDLGNLDDLDLTVETVEERISPSETNVFDYQGETFAQIGLTRTGPDLSNVGFRIDRYAKEAGVSPEAWLYGHLYDPRAGGLYRSVCAPQKHLFKVSKPTGEGDNDALANLTEDGEEIVPKAEARALASYLLSMKKNDLLPYSLNSRADKKTAAEQ